VPPRIASFTGRADELDKLDAILVRDKPAAVTQVQDKPAEATLASVGRAAVQGMGGVGKTSLSTIVRPARVAGSNPHLASVLLQRWKSANITPVRSHPGNPG
jgi:hypothetical protein